LAIAVFFVAAALAVVGAIGVVTFRQPIRSVLSLVVVMIGLSILFLLLSAQFLFVPAREIARSRLRFQTWLSALFVLVLLGLIWAMLQGIQYRQPEKTDLAFFGTVQSIGIGLFTTYLYPFELTSILLLVAAIGAIYLSRKKIDDL
jgi:NADH-quinone oxidoreductase subunit J